MQRMYKKVVLGLMTEREFNKRLADMINKGRKEKGLPNIHALITPLRSLTGCYQITSDLSKKKGK